MSYPHMTRLTGIDSVFVSGIPTAGPNLNNSSLQPFSGVGQWKVALTNTTPLDSISSVWRKTEGGLDMDSGYFQAVGSLVTNNDDPSSPFARHVHGTIMIKDSVVAFPFMSILETDNPLFSQPNNMVPPHFLPIKQSLGSSGGGYHYVLVDTTLYRHLFDNQVADNYDSTSPLVFGWILYNRSSNDKVGVRIQHAHIEVVKFDKHYTVFDPVR